VNPRGAARLVDTPAFLLEGVTNLLPAHRQDWGRAMQAELAGIGPAPARWRFALGCTRAVLGRPAVIAKVGWWTSMAAVLVAAAVLAAGIPFGSIRSEAIAMVAFLAALFWLIRRPAILGPVASGRAARLVLASGFIVGAAKALVFLNGLRLLPHGPDFSTSTTLVVVWTMTLTVYMIALVRVTAGRSAVPARCLATGAGVGAATAAIWLIVVLLWPSIPSSSAPEIFAITASAAAAVAIALRSGRVEQGLLSGLLAAASTALVIGVLIDGPLPALARWVPNSAPPVWPPDAPDRLVDSIGVWLLGLLLAAALSLAVRTNRSTPADRPRQPEPAAA
jgi:hypothetical protein